MFDLVRPDCGDPSTGEASIKTRTYKDAGVDIDAGAALVERIKPLARATARRGADAALGGFGAFFDLKAAGFRDPLLVAGTDGVGTKLKVAQQAKLHGTIGVDLVAMCVNDVVVQGAEPLFFLDYFATGRLELGVAEAVIAGIAEGCRQAGCALIGGETAEMPGMYGEGDYDLAGFAVGAVERDRVLTGARVMAGDAVIALASSGVHSNGFSLVRRIVEESGLDYDAEAPFAPGRKLGEALLVPTKIYVRDCLAALATGTVNALAHITGGGLTDNIPRVLPDGLGVHLDARAWSLPAVFRWLRAQARLDSEELVRTFNCGIGMVAIARDADADALVALWRGRGMEAHRVGHVVQARGDRVAIDGTESAWRD